MSVHVRKIRTELGQRRVVTVHGPWSPEADEVYGSRDCRGVVWRVRTRSTRDVVDPLTRLSRLEYCEIGGSIVDDSSIGRCHDLRQLSLLTRGKKAIEFELPLLETLALDWRPGISGLASSEALRNVTLYGHGGDELDELEGLRPLERLLVFGKKQRSRLPRSGARASVIFARDVALTGFEVLSDETEHVTVNAHGVADPPGFSLAEFRGAGRLHGLSLTDYGTLSDLVELARLPELRHVNLTRSRIEVEEFARVFSGAGWSVRGEVAERGEASDEPPPG